MRAILVRVGVDQAYGGWNAPVDPESGRFVFVPIPEQARHFHPGCERRYDELVKPLADFLCGDSLAKYAIGEHRGKPMHLDPDFEHLTYGEKGSKRGSQIRTLKSGDLLVFYSGMRPIRPSPYKLIYAIIGLFVIDEIVSPRDVPLSRWHENAHTRKVDHGPDDIVVRARPRVSGRCSRCLPVGEYRERAYRVRREILKAWGGLSVNDGYIQRSARPPEFTDPVRFYDWWKRQEVDLVRSNFVE